MPSHRILVVDDSPSLRRMIGACLRAGGYVVTEAVDGTPVTPAAAPAPAATPEPAEAEPEPVAAAVAEEERPKPAAPRSVNKAADARDAGASTDADDPSVI